MPRIRTFIECGDSYTWVVLKKEKEAFLSRGLGSNHCNHGTVNNHYITVCYTREFVVGIPFHIKCTRGKLKPSACERCGVCKRIMKKKIFFEYMNKKNNLLYNYITNDQRRGFHKIFCLQRAENKPGWHHALNCNCFPDIQY